MTTIHEQAMTADLTDLEQDPVLFLIGARVNKPWRLGAVRTVATAMSQMLTTLAEQPELGLLHVEQFRRGRTALLVQYWRSHEHLQRFATDKQLPHAPAWARFHREVAATGAVGIWHETYIVPRTNVEAIYAGMPRFGLAAATTHRPVREVGRYAGDRLRHHARAGG